MQEISLEEYSKRLTKEIAMEEAKLDVARSMLADGLPTETIRKYTGLDESSILSLR
jgi:predicted transposase YdaD